MQSAYTPSDKPVIFLIDESDHHRQVVWQVFNESLRGYELRLFNENTSLPDVYGPSEQMGLVLISTQSIDSLELVKRLKHQPRWRHIPIVIVSSEADPAQVAAYYEAGVNSFIVASEELKMMQQVLQTLCAYWFGVHHQAAYI